MRPNRLSDIHSDIVEQLSYASLKDAQALGLAEDEDDGPDMVNRPAHYASGGIECIDAIEEAVKDLNGLEAHCTACALKYLWRWKKKNGREDLAKARWYINKMLGDA